MSSYTVSLADISLLLRKIVVGVVVAAVPLLIIIGSLWLTRTVLNRTHDHAISTSAHSNP